MLATHKKAVILNVPVKDLGIGSAPKREILREYAQDALDHGPPTNLKDPRFAKFVLFTNALVPLAILGWDVYRHQASVNPVLFAIHVTGVLAILFLTLSLAVTPLRQITGRNWLSHFRRMLGLYAFFYGCVHLLIYFVFDRQGSISALASEIVKRPFILYGMTALLLMFPLALTSTTASIKRLGAARWKLLHRLAYPAVVLGVIHYWNATKLVGAAQWMFAIFVALLLSYRIFRVLPTTRAKPAPRNI